MNNKSIVLLSGGLDSCVTLAYAVNKGYTCLPISFDYNQRHQQELQSAYAIAKHYGLEQHHILFHLNMSQIKGSALTDPNLPLPVNRPPIPDIPITYVPARNTIFLSYALALAEVQQIEHVFIGVNALDYSGYPDCRPAYIDAYQQMAKLATRAGVEGQGLTIHTPLIYQTKSQIIQLGINLRAPLHLTRSCYNSTPEPCGVCDSCQLRAKGFAEAKVPDPAL